MTPDDDTESSTQLSTSYIYPVKSLLTGIQPAPPTQSRPSIPRRNSTQSGGLAALQDLLTHQLTSTRKKPVDGPDGVSPNPMSSRSHSMFYSYPSRTAVVDPPDMSEDHPHITSDPLSLIMQPIDRQSSLPISVAKSTSPHAFTHLPISASSISIPPSESGLLVPNGPHSAPQSPENRDPTPFKPVPQQSLTEHLSNDPIRSSPTHSVSSRVSHISQSGIVHLPPLSSTSSRAGSRGSGSHTHNSSTKYFSSSNSNTSSKKMDQVPEAQEELKPEDGSSRSSSDLKPVEMNTQDKSEPIGELVTTRYRHETDEHGNHLVIGREGEIRRCEDEVRNS